MTFIQGSGWFLWDNSLRENVSITEEKAHILINFDLLPYPFDGKCIYTVEKHIELYGPIPEREYNTYVEEVSTGAGEPNECENVSFIRNNNMACSVDNGTPANIDAFVYQATADTQSLTDVFGDVNVGSSEFHSNATLPTAQDFVDSMTTFIESSPADTLLIYIKANADRGR